MIEFTRLAEVELDEVDHRSWLIRVAEALGKNIVELQYIFCSDDYLLNMNKKYLNHDTLTDIITFEYGNGEKIHGDIFISIDRVWDNARSFEVSFQEELHRVMVHGVLHLHGLHDKTDLQKQIMRKEENRLMKLFHVERNDHV